MLSSNKLKIIAVISMLLDHIGYILFPDIEIFRILGRLAFPIFAFMIAEGCKYTKNKKKYLMNILSMGIIYQIVYYLFDHSLYMCIFITFSLSIIMIYALQNMKKTLSDKKCTTKNKILSVFILIFSITAVYFINQYFVIDYGFWGCMLPVSASIFHNDNDSEFFRKYDKIPVNVLTMGITMLILAIVMGGRQYYSLFALPLLMLYSGERGKHKIKNFFYIFYPAHLVILQGICIIIN